MGDARATAAVPFGPADYAVPGTYLDNAARHPLPQPVVAHLQDRAAFLGRHDADQGLDRRRAEVKALFATLIGADPDEIALVPSTVAAEMMLVAALRQPSGRRRIVTDALHFAGSLHQYRRLMATGVPVTIVPQDANRIDPDRVADALKDDDVALLALSSVSHVNGFRHDLRGVCDLAHARGVPVYADVIQHAGALPLDVRTSGIDFCACGTYKWLLGDMGLAFLYARRDRWNALGGAAPADAIEMGTVGASAVEALSVSLPRTLAFMAPTTAAPWRTLMARIDDRFGALGLTPLSPLDGAAPIRAFTDARITAAAIARLRAEGIRMSGRDGYLRLSPSVFTTPAHIDHAAALLAGLLA